MTIEERVARLEQRADSLDRLEASVDGLRADFNRYAADNAKALEQILATLKALQARPVFRWPWEARP